MAQTNYTPIYLYSSGTTGNSPSAGNLGAGELAINYTDGKLFYKDNANAVQVIGWKTTPTTAGGTGLTSYTAGDLPYYASGSALSKLGIGTSGYVLQSNGSAPTWVAQSTLSVGTATNATNTAITDNTSSSSTWYPTIVSATTGNLPQTTSSTKLSFVPSTGILTATGFSGAHNGTVGATTANTGAFTTLSASTSIQNATWITSGRPTGSTGLIGYNTTYGGLEVYNGSAWDAITGGPTFSAYVSTAQNVSGSTWTKAACDGTQFNVGSCYSTSTYRFTPTVPGYYLITGQIYPASYGNNPYTIGCSIYKNGSAYINNFQGNASSSSYSNGTPVVTTIIYMNGSSDYVELWGYLVGGSGQLVFQNVASSIMFTCFSGSFLRGA